MRGSGRRAAVTSVRRVGRALALALTAGCSAPADGVGPDVGTDGGADAAGGDVTATCYAAEQIVCGRDCVFAMTDEENCGGCGARCGAGRFCYAGGCHAQQGNYAGAPVAAAYVRACDQPGSTRVLMGQDDRAVEVELPIAFTFFRYRFPVGSRVGVSSNGYVQFDGAAGARGGSAIDGRIPDTSAPDGVVAPFWTDLIARSGVCAATLGAAPDRRWVVQWDDAQFYADPGAVPGEVGFEVILSEGTGAIEMQYESVAAYDPGWSPRRVTVGVENLDGTRGVATCDGVPVRDCRPVATRYAPVP